MKSPVTRVQTPHNCLLPTTGIMRQNLPDPNRYADGLEAIRLRARLEDEQAELAILQSKSERADSAFNDAETRFREVEAEFLHLKAMRDDAAAYAQDSARKKTAQTVVVAQQSAFFHPVRKMPLELLGRIFEECLEHPDIWGSVVSYQPADYARRQRQPFRLAAVSRRWRQASLDTPRAWNSVEVVLDFIKQGSTQPWVDYMVQMLQRSRSVPMTIRLCRKRSARPYDSQVIQRIIYALPRCTAIDLKVAAFQADDSLLAVLTASAPGLLYADLISAHDASTAALKTVRVFPDSASLRTLRAVAFFRLELAAFPALESAVVTHAKAFKRRDDISHLLRTSPLLNYVRLEFPLIRGVETHPSVPIVAANLKQLVLDVQDITPLDEVFDFISFPSLEWLSLFGRPASAPNCVAFLTSVAQSARNIAGLDIGALSSAVLPAFLDALAALQKLYRLNIDGSRFAAADLALIASALGEAPWRCPVLQQLEFRNTFFAAACNAEDMLRLCRGRVCAASDKDGPALLEYIFVGTWEAAQGVSLQEEVDELLTAAWAAVDEQEQIADDPDGAPAGSQS